ncbi:tetratricopeptide repeat-containing sensor histidine kinase [Flavobacterium sp.]|uniref:tetratricopeptide repeat-containing sensor histidine kinase n=1 Tax=Flavobacterium sp. TaxID=239 RepID=UPI002EDB431A
MANIQQVNGDYYGSKETLTEALPYVKNDYNYSAAVNNLFGIAYKELSLYNDAIFYYSQAIKGVTDSISTVSPLNNIGVVYIKQKKYDNAIQILESILNKKILDDKPSSIKSKARVIDNLGFAYFKKGLDLKGLNLLNEGLKLRMQLKDEYGCIGSYLHLAEFYSQTDSKKSNDYAKKAYEIATQFHSVDERLKALSILIANDSGTKYAQKYIVINDSIITVRNNFKNKFAKIKYDSKKEKDENQKLRLKNAENQLSIQRGQYQQYLFITISLFLGVLIFYLRKYYRNKNRTEKLQTAYDTETRIAKDIHDELANDVFNTITFTQTQSLEIESTRETLVQKLDHIYARVRGISKENNSIDIKTNYALNLKEMLSTYNSENRNVIINSIEKVNWDLIEEIKKVTIYRVLQELMVNMKKHSEALVVVVKFDSDGKTIFIDYTDNGKGTQKDKIVKNGLLNMENRILSSKGTITFDTEPDKGFRVKITMPK